MPKNDQPGCLFAIFKLFGTSSRRAEPKAVLPYRRNDDLLTKAEGSFFHVLRQAVGDEYLIFAKVRLADVVVVPKGTEGRQTHFNRIQSKHVDFLLCDKDSIRPLLAIELDDASHQRSDRRDRDSLVDEVLAAAGIPLLRVHAQSAYNLANLRDGIRSMLAQSVP